MTVDGTTWGSVAVSDRPAGLKSFYYEYQYLTQSSYGTALIGFFEKTANTKFTGGLGDNRYFPWPHAYFECMTHWMSTNHIYGSMLNDSGSAKELLKYNIEFNKDNVFGCGVQIGTNSTKVTTYANGIKAYENVLPFTIGSNKLYFNIQAEYSTVQGQVRVNFGKNGFKYPEIANQYFG